jgi:hypothetical protein
VLAVVGMRPPVPYLPKPHCKQVLPFQPKPGKHRVGQLFPSTARPVHAAYAPLAGARFLQLSHRLLPGEDWNEPAPHRVHVGEEIAPLAMGFAWIFPAGHCTQTGTCPVFTPALQDGDSSFPAAQAGQGLISVFLTTVHNDL